MAAQPSSELPINSAQDSAQALAQIAASALIVDSGRRRPFYFDGRFLTAADLTADQDYIRGRQSDLAQATGAGIIRGLMVHIGTQSATNSPTLIIEPGLGLTPAGDLVQIDTLQTIAVASLPESPQLDAQLGIKVLPGVSAANRSGLYVLALRAIEFSANPTVAYPTTLTGPRTVRDGDIVEATALTLIPYPDRVGIESAPAKRARVAREIFFDRHDAGALQDALPLAMLYLSGGTLQWLDPYLVRREVGAESTLAAGLNPRPRSLLEAWLKQHQDHLDDIPTASIAAGFAAASNFEVLPPVGPMPAATLRFETQLGQLTLLQSYFPPLVDCDFAFIPADELAALVQESLALPPVDLRAADDDLDHLSILIVAPVTRQELESLKRSLQTVTRPIRAASAGLIAKRSPLESLIRLSQPDAAQAPTTLVGLTPDAQARAWQQAIESLRTRVNAASGGRALFWYLRRRQLPYTSEISSATLRLAGNARLLDQTVAERLAASQLQPLVDGFAGGLPTLARAELTNLLAAPRLALSTKFNNGVAFATTDLLRHGAVAALGQRASLKASQDSSLAHEDVLDIARHFGDPRLGEGWDALAQAADSAIQNQLASPTVALRLAASGFVPHLDLAARALPPPQLKQFAQQIAVAAQIGDDAKRLTELTRLAGVASQG
jgi:hypothetical protein